jgi:hypothetical protein
LVIHTGPDHPLPRASYTTQQSPNYLQYHPIAMHYEAFGQPDYYAQPMSAIHITDIEAAINHWRNQALPPDGVSLRSELGALAEVYGVMAFERAHEIDATDLPRQPWMPG